MKAVQTYSKKQAFQASDLHSPVSFAIQQSELPICYRQGLKGQRHLSCDCPQQAFQSPPQDLKLCLSRCAWGVITMRTQKLCPVHACIWPCLLRQTSWSDYLAVHTHSKPDGRARGSCHLRSFCFPDTHVRMWKMKRMSSSWLLQHRSLASGIDSE